MFRNHDGTPLDPSDKEKKALILLKGGKDMKTLFTHVGNVVDTDTFDQAVKKVKDKLEGRTNKVVQRNMLLSNHPQGTKSFEKWSQQISEAASLIDYTNYDWKQAAVDAMMLQSTNSSLVQKALAENATYDQLIKLGIAKEQSKKGAALLEQASGNVSDQLDPSEEVRRLQLENKKLRKRNKKKKKHTEKSQETRGESKPCFRCLNTSCIS